MKKYEDARQRGEGQDGKLDLKEECWEYVVVEKGNRIFWLMKRCAAEKLEDI